eukprot:GHVP01040018.1.p1 GENE.GHVP01040018.1~~GHVP01040018.1.p1  ORF type:complete len:139 (-),score=38.28 GHVP01040018.1:53-469(-)
MEILKKFTDEAYSAVSGPNLLHEDYAIDDPLFNGPGATRQQPPLNFSSLKRLLAPLPNGSSEPITDDEPTTDEEPEIAELREKLQASILDGDEQRVKLQASFLDGGWKKSLAAYEERARSFKEFKAKITDEKDEATNV